MQRELPGLHRDEEIQWHVRNRTERSNRKVENPPLSDLECLRAGHRKRREESSVNVIAEE